ncbi:PREDICTED: uncharacterized protein LOC106813460 [Priapulus caudatus]|uniref:Uncharacterized protein LOC106813460 n=1 Tax=Priapulus caudatus TaxID=37621 RepID=A0ABM1ELK7_PRICU|nr:PREDICTED: uncharacterized protein LOC106813460 [Priapulus caudatus]
MLCARTTPIDNHLPSPAELMFNRKVVSNLPIKVTPSQWTTHDPDKVQERLKQRQDTQKHYHDRTGTKDLPPLCPGQFVTLQDHNSGHWSPAKVIEKCLEPRSYMVETPNGGILRRNRKQLRETPWVPKRVHFQDGMKDLIPNRIPKPAESTCEPKGSGRDVQASDTSNRTRSGRISVKPDRLDL